jgi:Major Facilitator Superfamily
MGTVVAPSAVERSAIRKIAVRLVPFVALMFFINYLDRTAISFAGPNGMNEDLGLTAAQFGLASGVFFIGYILLEIPSNIALHKFGARKWLARIMVSWGIVSLLFTFVQNVEGLYALRVILGIAEAGFFPGAILFLSLWVPARYRSKVLALFYVAQPLTTVIGAPLAGALISADGILGLEGWRFMFLCVSLPAIVIGVIAWFYLSDKPADAKWLTTQEKTWLTGELTMEESAKTGGAQALHTEKGAARREPKLAGMDSRLHLLRLHLRPVCPGLLPADDHLGLPGAVRHHVQRVRKGPHHRHPVSACRGGAAAVVARRHPPWCEDLAHRGSRGSGRPERPAGAVHGFARGDHRRDHRDGVRHLRGIAELLDRPG